MTLDRRKLIEVSLPLEVINREAAREKSIRHGHPSTLHLWWARRPLAAARAVLFAQLVDDPSAHPDRYPTEEDQQRRRKELHALIEKLVAWENSNNAEILGEAHKEILDSTGGNPPTILDPFAGGGTIPLEAQRLGLNAVASDLNPVAVLINKALIELPPRFRGMKPVYPGLADSEIRTWTRAEGLAADVRAYGQWMRGEVQKRIGHLYPTATLADGSTAPVIAWIWARTVICPNPRCRIEMPLVRSWWLGKKPGKEAYVVPRVVDGVVHFGVGKDPKDAPTPEGDGTIGRNGATCVACHSAIDFKYIRAEARIARMGTQLMTVVAEGNRQRIYLPPDPKHEELARIDRPDDAPDGEIPGQALGFRVQSYGFARFAELFTARQLTALITLSNLVVEAGTKVRADACESSNPDIDAAAYASAVTTYLAFAVSRLTSTNSSLCRWNSAPSKESVSDTFARQAISMVWDFAEGNILTPGPCELNWSVGWVARAIEALPAAGESQVIQAPAQRNVSGIGVLATDPPYYDNIGYADLSDYFYIWLRRCLRESYPDLLETMLVPKAEELVANPFRHGGNEGAKQFFEDGFTEVFAARRAQAQDGFPITVFYAFKQSESTSEGTASAGWETLLEGMVQAGWEVTGTWPIRSERSGRVRSVSSNALASSVVLALRPRPMDAATVDRRGFIAAMKAELPRRLRELQQGAIAPVDLPQAAIGPGMAVFSRYAKVIESDGSAMSVRSALARINEALDEVLSEQEGDFDATTRFAISWYRQHGYDAGAFGAADNMARARNTSVAAMERAGILTGRAGKVALLLPSALPGSYDPVGDSEISTWEVLHHLVRVLDSEGVAAAGAFLAQVGSRADGGTDPALVKELVFLLFSVADAKRWAKDAIAFNIVATSWGDLIDASRSGSEPSRADPTLDFATDDEEA